MSISGVGGSNSLFQTDKKHQNRQEIPNILPSESQNQTAGPTTAGSTSSVGGAAASPPTPGTSDLTQALGAINDAVKEFTDFLKESPAQRMQDAWLKEHGITKEQFNAMSPAEKQKLMDQMKAEIELKIKQKSEASLYKPVNVVV